MPVWLLAFAASTVLTLVLTPLSRRLALATDLVDKPGHHKSHIRPTPYLGGVGLIASVLVAVGLDSRANPRLAAIALGGAVIGTLGLLDDDRTVDPRLKFLAELGVAAVVTSLGLRIHASGIAAVDVALTLLWLVGVTNAFNLLDNMDGLAAGVAAAAAAAVFALAIMGLQPVVATTAAAVVGACVAFLAYNRPPASIFMGDAGSLFLGFVLAVLTISVAPALDPPFSFTVPLILLALPVLDTSMVTLARLRRGLKVSLGGKDHLSHRLVALGLSRGRAVATLIGVEAALGVLAVLAGRRVLQLRWVALAAAVVLCLLAGLTARATVYVQPVMGLPRRLRLAAGVLVMGTVLIAAPAALALARAASTMRGAVQTAELALDSLSGADSAGTATGFHDAAHSFARADRMLRGPLVSLGLAVPGLSSALEASRTLASEGERVSAAGAVTAGMPDGGTVPVSGGSVGLQELSRLAVALSEAAESLRISHERLAGVERPFLVPALQRAVREMGRRLERESTALRRAATGARVVPALLGAAGPRHYLLVFQNDEERRATGGVVDSWAELVAQDGALRLERAGVRQELETFDASQPWKDVNVFPDFPTAARGMMDLYTRSGGSSLDGVVAVDTVGLSALLELTGPVRVDGWPNPIGAGNLVDVLDVVGSGPGPLGPNGRAEVVARVLATSLHALTTADLGSAGDVMRLLGRAAQERHLLLYLSRPDEEALVDSLNVDGSLDPVRGDSLLVVNQGTSPADDGTTLRRRVRYDVLVRPGKSTADVSGRLEVSLVDARSGRLQELPRHLSVYSPFDAVSASLGRQSVEMETAPDLGRRVHSAVLSSGSDQPQTMTVGMRGPLRLTPDGWYRLDVLQQPSLPQDLEVSVTVPPGWRIAETQGIQKAGDRHAATTARGAGRDPILVRIERTGLPRVWDRLTSSP